MRKLRYFSMTVFFVNVCISSVECWWLMAQMSAAAAVGGTSTGGYCSAMPGLSRRQRTLCFQHPAATRALHDGLRLAFDECRAQFANHRWNCSVADGGFGLALRMASAEVAFLYAITAAGASHALARECARGTIPDCGCGDYPLRVPPLSSRNPHTVIATGGPSPTYSIQQQQQLPYYAALADPQAQNSGPFFSPVANSPADFTWAGCSHNVKYANAFGRKFVDSTEKQHMDARALMNLHNNRAGRKALATNLRRQCKCHGVSGSCVTKTCWSVVPTIEELGAVLKRKHERAQQVAIMSDGGELIKTTDESRKWRSEDSSRPHRRSSTPASEGKVFSYRTSTKNLLPASRADLVFLEASPDYCERDPVRDVPGTTGRECGSPDECSRLCCGRGWRTRRQFREEPCHCQFVWCCEVKCDMCVREIEIHFCK